MKQTLLIAFTIISLSSISQSFTVQDNNMSLSGQYTDNDFSKNTFLEALLDDSLTWEIVVDSMPSTWEFSNCFPNCYNIGVTSGDLVVLNGQSYYLNCHIYPNNTAGEGLITMKISNGAGTTEFVTWHGIAGSVGIIDDFFNNKDKIKRIYNLNGQIVKYLKPNTIYIVELQNGVVYKTFISN